MPPLITFEALPVRAESETAGFPEALETVRVLPSGCEIASNLISEPASPTAYS